MALRPIAAAAAFLLETGMLGQNEVTPGEVTLELSSVAQQPADAFTLPSNTVIGTGGIQVALVSGSGQSKVTHFKGWSAGTGG